MLNSVKVMLFVFDWKDGWVHLCASMTEPIIRMIVEFKSKEKAEDMVLQIRGLLERAFTF